MNKERIEEAKKLAHQGHNSIGQVRKYSGEPYTVHLDEVAKIVEDNGGTEDQIVVAYLHDLLEDVAPIYPWYSYGLIESGWGDHVANGVFQLTHHFTPENFPKVNRRVRKQLEADRLSIILPEWQTVKYADMLSNSNSIIQHDPEFARVYLLELAYLLDVMKEGDQTLYGKLKTQLGQEFAKLRELDLANSY